MKNLILTLAVSISCLFAQLASAQTHLDVGVGLSNQDNGLLSIAVRKAFSEKFRAGIELQSGLVNYRFIGAKVIDEGVSTSISIPFSVRLYEFKKLRLDYYTRVGVRFQSVDQSFADENKLQANTSFGLNAELGLQVSLALTEKLNVQSGVTLPNLFEIDPEFIYENNVTNLFAGVGYQLSEKLTFMLRANAGPAAGASGDSQKFIWGLQTGLRFSLKGNQNTSALRLDPLY
ncbi:hypothetical protein SAMN05661096_03582 [Marivirga sericea]|uniref:Outer membrane protein beta-barrel domain-containing protein n=1 Tax=Marivirga sericea TaxID=1028 RepID=A0A1X7L6X9_9BACT|nr:hypothetical protein [Marivirga sericea]SMG49214.1 hypothetical protein SAMN05661096_03582 [Marivirga sericea]